MTFSEALFIELFKPGPHPAYQVTKDALPADAEIVDVVHNAERRAIHVWIKSEFWPNSPVNGPLSPELQILLPSEISVPIPVRRAALDESITRRLEATDEEIPDGWDESDVAIEVLRLRGLTADGPAVG
jgi:hypothetical protein